MVKISIMYLNEPDKKFDYDYYLNNHIPATIKVIKDHPDFEGISVVRGVSLTTPGSEPAYLAACYINFASQKGFLEAFMPHAAELQADMPNYTDIKPITQFNKIEVLESKA